MRRTLARLATLGLVAGGLVAGSILVPPTTAQARDEVAPRVDRVSDHTVLADGHHTLTIDGAGFDADTVVWLGHDRAPVQRASAQQMTVLVPAGQARTVAVQVERAGRRSAPHRAAAVSLLAPSRLSTASQAASSKDRIRTSAVEARLADPRLAECIADALSLPVGASPTTDQVASLRQLNCQDRGITSLDGLQAASQLVAVDVSRNAITSLEPLRRTAGLQRLWASDNQISSLSALTGKTSLALLDLAGNQVADLTPLGGNGQLAELVLDDNQVSSLAPLARLDRLGALHLAFNRVSSVEAVASLPLRELHLWGNQVSQLTPLAGRTTLQHLDLSHNRVATLAPLAGLTGMVQLNVEGNSITDLTPVSRMTGLVELNASSNRVRSVAPLAPLTKLYWVFVRNNALTDLSALRALPAPSVEAQGQVVTLPVTTRTTTAITLRTRQGSLPRVSGASVTPTTLTWPGIGARQASFSTTDLTFDGVIRQTVRPRERFGDANDDGLADLFTISGSTMQYRAGQGFALSAPSVVAGDWSSTTMLAPMHDNTDDRVFELMSRDRSGTLWMHPVLGAARLGGRVAIGRNWNDMTLVTPAGQLDGSTTQYVVARRSDGNLFRYTVTAQGLTGIRQIGWHWNGMRQVVSVGDWTGDLREDVVGLRNDGTLWLYEATASGTLRPGRQVGHGWGNFTLAAVPGDLSGDRRPDLVGLRNDGVLFGYQNQGGRWGTARQMASGLAAVRLLA